MKITIVQGPFLPIPPILGGAIEKVFFPLGQYWASQGHTVTHISRSFSDLLSQEKIKGVEYLRFPSQDSTASILYNKFLDLRYSLRVFNNLPSADILITHTFFLPLLARFMDKPRRRGAVFVHVGRFPHGQLPLYRGAARFQFPSTAVAHAAIEQSPALQRDFTVIPYPLSSLPSSVPPHRLPEPPYTLLYAGRLHPEKGVHLLLKSLAALPPRFQSQINLRIVGPHEEKMGGAGESYLSLLKSLSKKTSSNINFVGGIFKETDLAKEYAAADLFVYPSLAERGETFGLAPLEALSHGTPVLVSALDCFKDFVTSKNGFIFDHRTAAPVGSLAAAIKDALMNFSQWTSLSAEALKTASHFSLETVGERFIKEFETIISPH